MLGSPSVDDPASIVGAATDLLVTEAAARDRIRDRLRLVVVDDAQETTSAGVRLLTALARIGVDVVLLGDPDSAVQTFRGGDPRWFAPGGGRDRRAAGPGSSSRSTARVRAPGDRRPRPTGTGCRGHRRRGRPRHRAHRGARHGRPPHGGARRTRRTRRGARPALDRARGRLRRGEAAAGPPGGRVPWSGMAVLVRGQGRTATLRRVLPARRARRDRRRRAAGAGRAGGAAAARACSARSSTWPSGAGTATPPRRSSTCSAAPSAAADAVGLRRLRRALRRAELARGATGPARSCSPAPSSTRPGSRARCRVLPRPPRRRDARGRTRGRACPPGPRRPGPLGARRHRRDGALGDVAGGRARRVAARGRSRVAPPGARRPRPRRRGRPVRGRRALRRPAARPGPRLPRAPGRPGGRRRHARRAGARRRGRRVLTPAARRGPGVAAWWWWPASRRACGRTCGCAARCSGSERAGRRRRRTVRGHSARPRRRPCGMTSAGCSTWRSPAPASGSWSPPCAARTSGPRPISTSSTRATDQPRSTSGRSPRWPPADPAGAGRRAAPRRGRAAPTAPRGPRPRPRWPGWPRAGVPGRRPRRSGGPGAAHRRPAAERRRGDASRSRRPRSRVRRMQAALAARTPRRRRAPAAPPASARWCTTSPPSARRRAAERRSAAELDAAAGRRLGLPTGLGRGRKRARRPAMVEQLARYFTRPAADGWTRVGAEVDVQVELGRARSPAGSTGWSATPTARLPGRRPQDRQHQAADAEVADAPPARRLPAGRRAGAFAEHGDAPGGAALVQLGKAAAVRRPRSSRRRCAEASDPGWARRLVARDRRRDGRRAPSRRRPGEPVPHLPGPRQLPGPARGQGRLRVTGAPRQSEHGRHRRRLGRRPHRPTPSRPRSSRRRSTPAAGRGRRRLGQDRDDGRAGGLAGRQRPRRARAGPRPDLHPQGRRRAGGAGRRGCGGCARVGSGRRRDADGAETLGSSRPSRPTTPTPPGSSASTACGSGSSRTRGCSPRPAAWQLADGWSRAYDGDMTEVDRRQRRSPPPCSTLAGEMRRAPASTPTSRPRRGRRGSRRSRAVAGAGGPGLAARRGRQAARQRCAARGTLLPLVEALPRAASATREALDFGDQMALAARVARDVPRSARSSGRRFRVVLLDEYQDTSHAQLVLLRALFAPAGHAGHRGRATPTSPSTAGAARAPARWTASRRRSATPSRHRAGRPPVDELAQRPGDPRRGQRASPRRCASRRSPVRRCAPARRPGRRRARPQVAATLLRRRGPGEESPTGSPRGLATVRRGQPRPRRRCSAASAASSRRSWRRCEARGRAGRGGRPRRAADDAGGRRHRRRSCRSSTTRPAATTSCACSPGPLVRLGAADLDGLWAWARQRQRLADAAGAGARSRRTRGRGARTRRTRVPRRGTGPPRGSAATSPPTPPTP